MKNCHYFLFNYLSFTVKVCKKGLNLKKNHTATIPSKSGTKVSLTNPREVMS